MKKQITLIVLLLLTGVTHAQSALPRSLDFWDGTFAYNRLTLSENRFDSPILKVELSGASLALGEKLEGLAPDWGIGDKIVFSIKKSDCEIDFVKEEVECHAARVSGTISWTVNPRITKSLKSVFENLKIKALKSRLSASVLMEFDIPSDQYFSPAQKRILVDFDNLNF